MSSERQYKIVEIDADDKAEAFKSFGVEAAYSLDKWDHVLVVEVDKNFNINRNAAALQKTFGFGANKPMIITRTPMRFFRVEAVDSAPGFWARTWTKIKRLFGKQS